MRFAGFQIVTGNFFLQLPGFAGLSQTARNFKPTPVSTGYETLEKHFFYLSNNYSNPT